MVEVDATLVPPQELMRNRRFLEEAPQAEVRRHVSRKATVW